MNPHLKHSIASLAFALPFAAPAQAPTKPPANQEAATELAPVIVTGTKRPETLQNVAASVAVIRTADEIDTPSLYDLLNRIPNLTMTGANSLPSIRGNNGNGVAEGGGGAVTGGRPRVATVVDGVARSYSFALDGVPSTWDVEQIEIYRGAQSTTQGRNSIAGAFVVNTAEPVFKQEFAGRIGVKTEDTTYFAAAMANLPWQAAEMAFRFTAETTRGDSYVDVQAPELEGLEPEKIEFDRLRGKALWAPSTLPQLRLRLGLDYQHVVQPSVIATTDGDPADYRLSDLFNYANQDADTTALSLRPEWTFNDRWKLEGILARQEAENRFPSLIGLDPTQLDVFADTTEDSLETRLLYTAPASRSNAVIGSYLFQRDRVEGGTPGSAFEYAATDKGESIALFADGRLQVASQWDVRAGLRVERETQERVFNSPFGLALTVDETAKVFLPKLGVDYHHTPDRTLGASYYQGFQPGGGGVSFDSFTPYTFDPEYSQTGELSLRTQWLERRLTLNANVFYTRNRDQQYFANGPGGASDPIILNAQRTVGYGAEFDAIYRPRKGLRLFAGLGLLHTEVKEFGDAANDARLNGNRLGVDPDFTVSGGFDVTLLPGWTAGANAQFVDDYFGTIDNDPRVTGGDYALTNVQTRYVRGAYSVNGYVNNVFDRLVIYSRDPDFGTNSVAPPRTVGVSLEARF